MSKDPQTTDKAPPKAKEARPRRTKKVDPAYEYKRVLTVLSREVGRLLDLSATKDGVGKDGQRALVEYIKILNDLNELHKLEQVEATLKKEK